MISLERGADLINNVIKANHVNGLALNPDLARGEYALHSTADLG